MARRVYFSFHYDRAGGYGGYDIWVSSREHSGQGFGDVRNLGATVNTAHFEGGPSLSTDGRLLYLMSDRPGGIGSSDLWVVPLLAGRPVGEPRNLGSPVNSPAWEFGPDLSADCSELYFASNRPGGLGDFDIWVAKRAK